MVNGIKGSGKYGSNGAGPGINVKGGGIVGALVRQRDVVGDGGDDQGPRRVPPPVGATDHGVDREMWIRQRVLVPPSSGGNGRRGNHPIGEYTRIRQANIAERVACRPIYELFTEAERVLGTIRTV